MRYVWGVSRLKLKVYGGTFLQKLWELASEIISFFYSHIYGCYILALTYQLLLNLKTFVLVFIIVCFCKFNLFCMWLNQIYCSKRKTGGETKKSKRKCFFKQKCFWSEPKKFAGFSGVSFVEKHKGNKWRYTKNLIKKFKFLFCFSRFARA